MVINVQRTLFDNKVIINNVHEAKDYFIKILERKGFRIVKVIPENFNRHYGIITKKEYNAADGSVVTYTVKWYLVYQRKWFQSFDKYFGIPSEAVTINVPILVRVVENNYDRIVWVNMEGKVYMINPKDMLYIVAENKWIRRTEKTGEPVAHLPLHELTPVT